MPPCQPADSTTATLSDVKKKLSVGARLRKLGKELGTLKDKYRAVPTLAPEPAAEVRTDDSALSQGTLEPEPEGATLAREIQHLVDSLPLPTSPVISSNPTPTLFQQSLPLSPEIPLSTVTDDPQQPQLKDSRLVALLSNASFMNGSSLKGKPSIWNILQNSRRTPSYPNPTSPSTSSTIHNDSGIQHLKQDEPALSPNNQIPNESSSSSMILSDTSSIMVYSPLFPTQSDFVELAELVPIDAESGGVEDSNVGSGDVGARSESEKGNGDGDNPQGVAGGAISWSWWPFSIWYGQGQTEQSVSQTQRPAEFTSNNNTLPGQRTRPANSQKSIRAWVPSPSKISVQAFWWGYRLYLPPPILEILSDKTLEAAKRSAVITTALTWFFNNLPVEMFPPPMQPGLILLQRLIPVLGYIGTFISWSWSTISSYDVGHGVTLTATWILPVALIPGTWFESDFPKSPVPNSPVSLPMVSMQSFVSPTMSATTDDDTPTDAYVTPMSSVVLNSPLRLVPDNDNEVLDPSLASSSTAWSACPLPTSSPIHHPAMISPSSPSSAVAVQSPTSVTAVPSPTRTPTFPASLTSTPSPRIRTPRFITHVKSLSPSIRNNTPPPPLLIHNVIPPPPATGPTPIPIPPTPIELPPIPPEPALSPKLVNELLRGPALQTVPLPDME